MPLAGARSFSAPPPGPILGANPLVRFRLRDVGRESFRSVKRVALQPRVAAMTLSELTRELVKVARDESQLAPDPKDRRWLSPAWKTDSRYRKWLQSYLALDRAAERLCEGLPLGALEVGRLRYSFRLLLDAIAPSNFPWQPEAVARFRKTRGRSALTGLSHLVRDLRHNRGLPSQVDKSRFKLGDNIACTEGSVVARTDLFELIQYAPRTSRAHETPVLIVPPQINKFYVFDLSPDKSVVRELLNSGFSVFVLSWRNPTSAHADWGLSDYTAAIEHAVTVTADVCASPRVNLVGACAGGLTLAAYAAERAALGDSRLGSLTMLVSLFDLTGLEETALGLFATPKAVEAARRHSRSRGILDGRDMAATFAWLRPNDLIWSYWVNNVLLGNEPPAFDILYWNNDTTRLPARLHSVFLDILRSNALATPRGLHVHGMALNLEAVRCDAYFVGGVTDHITPWTGVYRSAQLLGGQTTFVLSNSGHIQSILNPQGNKKAEFWTAPTLPGGSEAWRRGAEHQTGSWWAHWHEWLRARSGELVAAPAFAGNARHEPLAKAPGDYVRE